MDELNAILRLIIFPSPHKRYINVVAFKSK